MSGALRRGNKSGLACAVLATCLGAVYAPALAAPAEAAKPAKPAHVKMTLLTEPAEGLFAAGAQAPLVCTIKRSDEPLEGEVEFTVVEDNGTPVLRETRPLQEGVARIAFTMKKPCFVRCVAAYTNEAGKRLEAKAGVGFDAEKIRAGIPLPQDFDAFWAAARKERDAIPMDVRMTNRWKLANHDVMKISVANVQNSRFYGFLRVPRSGSGPRPAFLFIPGAGGGTDAGPRTEVVPFIMAGAITLAVHVHPYDVPPFDGERPDYKKVYNSGYSRQGGPDPKSYYFYKTILGIDRMIDYLAAREDWDGKHLVVQGISQGGGLSLIVAGLNSKVTAVAASIPGMCDHAAYRVGNVNGWPGLIPGHLRGQSGPEEELWANFAGYYDAANFAPRIRGPVISTVGLIDEAGRAAPAFAVFNRIATPKAMFTWSNGRHTDTAAYAKMKTAWIKGQLGLGKPMAPTMAVAEDGGRYHKGEQ